MHVRVCVDPGGDQPPRRARGLVLAVGSPGRRVVLLVPGLLVARCCAPPCALALEVARAAEVVGGRAALGGNGFINLHCHFIQRVDVFPLTPGTKTTPSAVVTGRVVAPCRLHGSSLGGPARVAVVECVAEQPVDDRHEILGTLPPQPVDFTDSRSRHRGRRLVASNVQSSSPSGRSRFATAMSGELMPTIAVTCGSMARPPDASGSLDPRLFSSHMLGPESPFAMQASACGAASTAASNVHRSAQVSASHASVDPAPMLTVSDLPAGAEEDTIVMKACGR